MKPEIRVKLDKLKQDNQALVQGRKKKLESLWNKIRRIEDVLAILESKKKDTDKQVEKLMKLYEYRDNVYQEYTHIKDEVGRRMVGNVRQFLKET